VSKLNSSYLKEAFNKRKPKFQSGTKYKPDFRSKSQMANQMGMQRDPVGYVRTKTPTEAKAIREKELAEIKRKVEGTIRETTDADREAQNRQDLTFSGNAEKRGASTPLSGLLDAVNPFSYYYAGKDALRGLGQAAEGLSNLDLGEVGSGLAGATLGALGAIPATSEFKPFLGTAGKMLPKSVLRGASSLGKPGISRNLSDLQAAKKFAKQYGYELPKNINRIAESDVLTDRTIRGLMNRHNTYVRGVSTNWDEVSRRIINQGGPEAWNDVVNNFKKQGIDYINNPKAAAEYMATHVPLETGYGRFGLQPGENALYLSNSIPTAEGYTYGQGFVNKVRRPTDFSSADRKDWLKVNDYPISYGFKGSPYGTGIVKNDYYKRIPTSIRDIAYASKNPNKMNQVLAKTQEAYDKAKGRHLRLENKYSRKLEDLYLKNVPKDIAKEKLSDDIGKAIYKNELINKYKDKGSLLSKAQEAYYRGIVNASHIAAESSVLPAIAKNILDKENLTAIGKNLVSPLFGKIDPFSHYAIKGNPGEQMLIPVKSWEVTPDIWQNKSRAHVGRHSRGYSQKELGGVISKPKGTYQMGGMSIPGVNGSVVSSYQATQYKKYKSKKK
jgi:hypothetical protein